MSNLTKILLTSVLLSCSAITSALPVLQGKMVLKSEDDPDITSMLSDGVPIKYRAIQLNQPKSFNLYDEVNDKDRLYKNQQYIQLVEQEGQSLKKIPLMSNIRVTCDELYTQHSIHHFTEVLCMVKRVEILK